MFKAIRNTFLAIMFVMPLADVRLRGTADIVSSI